MNDRVIRHVTIRGRVQGVGYRDWTRHIASEHGIEGWVRNRRDGAVEAVLAGPGKAVDATIAACRTGPRSARVDTIDERDATQDELSVRGGETFAVLPTA